MTHSLAEEPPALPFLPWPPPLHLVHEKKALESRSHWTKVHLCSASGDPLGGTLRVGFPLSWGFGRVHGRSQDAQDFLASYGVGLLSQPVELSTWKLMGLKKTTKKDPSH